MCERERERKKEREGVDGTAVAYVVVAVQTYPHGDGLVGRNKVYFIKDDSVGKDDLLQHLRGLKNQPYMKWALNIFILEFEMCFAPRIFGDWAQNTSQITIFGTILKRGRGVILCH